MAHIPINNPFFKLNIYKASMSKKKSPRLIYSVIDNKLVITFYNDIFHKQTHDDIECFIKQIFNINIEDFQLYGWEVPHSLGQNKYDGMKNCIRYENRELSNSLPEEFDLAKLAEHPDVLIYDPDGNEISHYFANKHPYSFPCWETIPTKNGVYLVYAPELMFGGDIDYKAILPELVEINTDWYSDWYLGSEAGASWVEFTDEYDYEDGFGSSLPKEFDLEKISKHPNVHIIDVYGNKLDIPKKVTETKIAKKADKSRPEWITGISIDNKLVLINKPDVNIYNYHQILDQLKTTHAQYVTNGIFFYDDEQLNMKKVNGSSLEILAGYSKNRMTELVYNFLIKRDLAELAKQPDVIIIDEFGNDIKSNYLKENKMENVKDILKSSASAIGKSIQHGVSLEATERTNDLVYSQIANQLANILDVPREKFDDPKVKEMALFLFPLFLHPTATAMEGKVPYANKAKAFAEMSIEASAKRNSAMMMDFLTSMFKIFKIVNEPHEQRIQLEMDYSKLTKAKLKAIAKQKKLRVAASASKDELVELIEQAELEDMGMLEQEVRVG